MPSTKAVSKRNAARNRKRTASTRMSATRPAVGGAGSAKLGTLPTWDLSDLFAGIDDPAVIATLDDSLSRATKFHERFAGKMRADGGVSAAQLASALAEYESIVEAASKASAYAQLLHEADSADPRHGALLATVMQRSTDIMSQIMFFDLEWMDVPDESADHLIADPLLARWRHYLKTARRFRPHKLTEPQEQVVNQLANTGSRAWQRFFDEFTAAMRYTVTIGGKKSELGQSETLAMLHEPDRKRRQAAAAALTEGLKKQERTLAYIFNTLLWDSQIDDQMRRFDHPMARRNLDNLIDQSTVDALIHAVEGGFSVVQRYYRLKGRLLGIKRLVDYDRYAPIGDKTPPISWAQARTMVLDSFNAFSPRVGDIAAEFFARNWIDAPVRPNKSGGAFSAATVPSVHPYILMNYTGKMRDVQTLAHELGHGVHQFLSRPNGILQASTPLTLAETASVFAEMLVFERLMADQKNPRVKLSMLCGKIEDTFATVFRQICMTRFEQRIHAARREKGELPVTDFNLHWLDVNRAMFGDVVELRDDYGWWWSYIHHFVSSPFYCYAYAFGELLVIALIGLYREQGSRFVPRYVELLSAGGSGTPDELLAPLGIDVRKPEFWRKGIEFIDDLVKQAEALSR